VLADNLHANRAGKFSVRLDDLKFRDAIFEFVRRQLRGEPERFECGQIIYRRAADVQLRHGLILQ
jgi:hypothetical protein